MNYICSENHLLQKEQEKQKNEMETLKQKLLEAEDELKKQASATPSPTVEIFIDKFKAQLASAEQTNQKQEKEFQDVMQQKTHLQTEAQEYTNQIVEYAKNLSEMESDKKRMNTAIADQNNFAQKMIAKERQHKQELEQATSQITTLKQLHMNNLSISKNKDQEMAALRQQLQSLENKMAELGIERDVPEDRELEEAIAISKTAEATAEISEAAIAAKAAPAVPAAPRVPPDGEEMDVDDQPEGPKSPSTLSWNCLM